MSLRGTSTESCEVSQKTADIMLNKLLGLLAPYKRIFIAYSGGADSHVLLHLLSTFFKSKKGIKLTAIHINHNLSPHAKRWDRHCYQVCKKLHIDYISKSIAPGIKPGAHSLEEILRKLRYEIFAKVLPKGACLVTAHQADDQAETLLLQLFRGAGPKGLAAMPEKVEFARGWLVRPLLGCSREDILFYAKCHKLRWIEDESNSNTKFDRNFIRHQLMPHIKNRWPACVKVLNRVSRHCCEASELLNILAEEDLLKVADQEKAHIIDVKSLKKLPLVRQKNVLRFWLHRLSLPIPSEVKLAEVIRTVVNSRYDAMPLVKWFGAEVRRFRHGLYAMPPLVALDSKRSSPALNKLKLQLANELKLDPKKIKLCLRKEGERVKLFKRQGTHELNKLLQEWSVPPWLRNRVPLIYYETKLIAVVGYYTFGYNKNVRNQI